MREYNYDELVDKVKEAYDNGEFGEALYDYSEGWDAKNQLENFLNEKISGDTYSKLMNRIIESIKKDEIHLKIDTSGMEIDENGIANDIKVIISSKSGLSYDYYLDSIELPDKQTFLNPELYFEARDKILLKNACDCIEEIFDYHDFQTTDLMKLLDENFIGYDDIVQVSYFQDPITRSGQYVVFIENDDYPSFEAFKECANAVFEDFSAIIDNENIISAMIANAMDKEEIECILEDIPCIDNEILREAIEKNDNIDNSEKKELIYEHDLDDKSKSRGIDR